MKKITTSYVPIDKNSPYVVTIRRLQKKENIETLSLKRILTSPKDFFACKIINFNWFENIDNKRQFIKKYILLYFLHFSGKKIVFTLHNKQPHYKLNNNISLGIKMMQILCKISDAIVGLCPDTEIVLKSLNVPGSVSKKLNIIPHPNYIFKYKNNDHSDLRQQYKFASDDMILLFLGTIYPYKNVELLLDVFQKINNHNIKLLMAGEVSDKKYQKKLLSKIKNKSNIICDFRYIPENEIAKYHNTSDIVILPYHKTSSLNSGAIYLSFSLKKTVICPDIGSINALKDHSFVYKYHYRSDEEHAKKLEKIILKAYNDFKKDPNIIKEKGERAFKYVQSEHSNKKIAQLYRKLYTSLLKGN